MKKHVSFLVVSIVLLVLSGCSANKSQEGKMETPVSAEVAQETKTPKRTSKEKVDLQIFIAASLKNAMTEIQTNYKSLHPEVEMTVNADSSGTLQKQIEEEAACDVFFSAATKQMKELNEGGYVLPDSVVELLENKVVLIKPIGGETDVTGFEDITKAANLALAGEEVPVGAYAREIFMSLGILDQVMAMEINEGANVTTVLSAVSEGSNEIGIVYATDAYSVKDLVEIIAEAPQGSLKKPVVYPVGLIKNEEASDATTAIAKDFVDYLQTEEAMKILEAYGFSIYNP